MKRWNVLIREVEADREQAATLSLRISQLLEELKLPGRVSTVESWLFQVSQGKPEAFFEPARDTLPGLRRGGNS